MSIEPKNNPNLVGHEEAESILLDSFNSGKIPHGWLITGPKGIGKATLAYRFARFLLSQRIDADSINLFGEVDLSSSLDMDEENPIFTRMVHGSLADFHILEVDEASGKQEITVDSVRKIGHFLSQTKSESSWRVVIVDSADEMNRNSANALLKLLEEPPENTVLLLISHVPGKLLPTIRSRCRFLPMKPLAKDGVLRVMGEVIPDFNPSIAGFSASISDGSPGLAISLYSDDGLEMYEEIVEIFSSMPELDISAIQKLGDKVARKENAKKWQMMTYMFGVLLSRTVHTAIMSDDITSEFVKGEKNLISALLARYSLDHIAMLWEKTGQITGESDGLNMDRKVSTMQLFDSMRKAG